ncbi:MAG: PEP-CTERM sorting domain-containing protein [Planctomycetales bacterium]|nr:PEP-CTERM sorting domain-containing protein [Planctomycetales bacterium]
MSLRSWLTGVGLLIALLSVPRAVLAQDPLVLADENWGGDNWQQGFGWFRAFAWYPTVDQINNSSNARGVGVSARIAEDIDTLSALTSDVLPHSNEDQSDPTRSTPHYNPIDGERSFVELAWRAPWVNTQELQGVGGGNSRHEFSLPTTDLGAVINVADYDNATDPSVRGHALLKFKYRIELFEPDPDLFSNDHPFFEHPFDVTNTWADEDGPNIKARFGLNYNDATSGANWKILAAQGDPGEDLEWDPDINNGAEHTFVDLIADGQTHEGEYVLDFLTADERAAIYEGNYAGGDSIAHELRIDVSGGGPRMITWDSIQLLPYEVVSAPGDFDGDGDVDGDDFLTWQADDRGAADYATWEANFGAPGSVAAAVPEPASAALIVLVAGALGGVRRRTA